MSMSKVKQEFFEGIKVVYKDFREDPERSRKNDENVLRAYGKAYFKKSYPITVRAVKEFIWNFRDTHFYGTVTERPEICYLDGERKLQFSCDFFIEKNGKVTAVFIGSAGEIHVVGDFRKKYRAKTSEEFISFARQIREDFNI